RSVSAVRRELPVGPGDGHGGELGLDGLAPPLELPGQHQPLAERVERLVLPGEFEGRREAIEAELPAVTVPRPDGKFAANRAD
ncbi:hypothetical protein DJ79_02305, partial [Halorubrum ezzemoulense]